MGVSLKWTAFTCSKHNIVSLRMHIALVCTTDWRTAWKLTTTYFSLHIWSAVINLGCVKERQLSDHVGNLLSLPLRVWNTCAGGLIVITRFVPHVLNGGCWIFPIRSLFLNTIRVALACPFLFHFGTQVQVILQYLLVEFCEIWHHDAESGAASLVRLKRTNEIRLEEREIKMCTRNSNSKLVTARRAVHCSDRFPTLEFSWTAFHRVACTISPCRENVRGATATSQPPLGNITS